MKILFLMVRGLTCLLALSFCNSLAAESLATSTGPAELPPAGFAGFQFVDSKGCVYIRAGQDGAVQWIPRVNRTRQLICGFAPSFSPDGKQKVQIKPLSIRTPAEDRHPEVSGTAVAPKPLATTALTVRGKIGPTEVPEGYRNAWEDDRLNIYSGLQAAEGLSAAGQLWSQDVPSEIIVKGANPKSQTHSENLVYPFTDIKQQKMFLEGKGNYVLEPEDNGAIRLVTRNASVTDGGRSQAALQSSNSGGLLVQVATFGVSANAVKTKSQLAAMGLPVQMRRITRAGKIYHVILTGPFEDARKIQMALARVRQAGFDDAFTVRR